MNPIATAGAIGVIIEAFKGALRDETPFRECASDSRMLSVWISAHARSLSEWCRSHVIKDVRVIDAMVSHGSDLERRIGILERFEPVLESPGRECASHMRELTISELSALRLAARGYASNRDFLSFVFVDDISEIRFQSAGSAALDEAFRAAKIAEQGFLADHAGWEALDRCIDRADAAARMIGDDGTRHRLAPLCASLLRCRAASRLIDHIDTCSDSHVGLALLRESTCKIMQIRFREVISALAEVKLEHRGIA